MYYFQWKVANSEGSGLSQLGSFQTTPPPVVNALPAMNVLHNSAVLNGRYDTNGGLHASIEFEYGETLAFGNAVTGFSIQNTMGTATHEREILQLKADTLYHYRVVSRNIVTQTMEYSQSLTFRTQALNTSPYLSDAPTVVDLNAAEATLKLSNFHTGTSETTIEVEYGATAALGLSSEYPFALEKLKSLNYLTGIRFFCS